MQWLDRVTLDPFMLFFILLCLLFLLLLSFYPFMSLTKCSAFALMRFEPFSGSLPSRSV